MKERKLLKIQKGNVYIQLPPTDPEAIKFAKEVLDFLIQRINEELSFNGKTTT